MADGTFGNTVIKRQENVQGIIYRTSAIFSSRYVYISLPHAVPADINNVRSHDVFADSLTAAPHFPDITILDSFACIILYQTYNSAPDFFHVYNLLDRRHLPIRFPYPHAFVNAAITIQDCIHVKVFVVCIENLTNPLFDESGDGNSSNPFIFYVYSSKTEKWLSTRNLYPVLNSSHLLTNRRKPAHTSEDVVYLDLTGNYLIRFDSLKNQFDAIPKLISSWETDLIDETARYAGCRGMLCCAKFNPCKMRIDIFAWIMNPPNGYWKFMASEKNQRESAKLLGLHPTNENLVYRRSEDNDEILLIDIIHSFQWVVVRGKGPKCGQACFLKGMTDVLKAALEGGEKLQPSDCGILHPHENVEAPQGEIFLISLFS